MNISAVPSENYGEQNMLPYSNVTDIMRCVVQQARIRHNLAFNLHYNGRAWPCTPVVIAYFDQAQDEIGELNDALSHQEDVMAELAEYTASVEGIAWMACAFALVLALALVVTMLRGYGVMP